MNVGMSERLECKQQQHALHWEIGCPEIGGALAEADVVAEPFLGCYMPVVTIKNCSLWPERKNCAQKCLRRNRANALLP
jgi:hypothetical protein